MELRIAESRTSVQAPVDREPLYHLLRAADAAVHAGLLRHWTIEDREALQQAQLAGLEAMQRLQQGRSTRDDEDLARTLGNAVLQAVNGRNTGYAAHTWKSFREALNRLVGDDEDIASIEFGLTQFGSRILHVERDTDGAVEVREVRRA